MMTQQLEVSILAAPVAAIDRRVLSQAWYSALRLVRRAPQFPVIGEPSRCAIRMRVGASPENTLESSSRAPIELRRHHVARAKRSTISGEEPKANALRRLAPLAQRIERVFGAPRSHAKRATFSMGRGNARVHVILQMKGERMTLLAVCRPEIRAVVAHALAQARCALAARGIGIELRACGVRRCS